MDDDSVPYHLLDSAVPTPGAVEESQNQETAPLIFWLRDDDQLIPAAIGASCGDQPVVVVERLLDELAAGPRDDARAAGLSTAIPPESVLALVGIADGTAEVEVEPATAISADRLPAAVGQIVLTVTSARGVQSVQFVSGAAPVPVPLPGGALIEGPVAATHYADFLADRDRNSRAAGCAEQ